MKTLLLALALLSANFVSVFARQNQINQPTFSGTITSSENKLNHKDSLLINYSAPNAPFWARVASIYIVTDQNGAFHFKIPRYEQPCYLQISMRKNGKYFRINEHYFAEPTDNVNIQIVKNKDGSNSTSFLGKGAEKYNIIAQLDSLHNSYRFDIKGLDLYSGLENLETKLTEFASLTESYRIKKKNVIDKSSLNPMMRKMLNYEFAPLYSTWAIRLFSIQTKFKNNPQVFPITIASYKKHYKEFQDKPGKFDPIMTLCPNYLINIASDEGFGVTVCGTSGKGKLETLYNKIKENYPFQLAEILIGNLFQVRTGWNYRMEYTNTSYDSLLRDSEKFVKTPFWKNVILDKLKLAKGQDIYNATFKDLNGNPVQLSDFKNKVVLLDMWNVGCSYCAIFHKKFKKDVYPLLKDNKDFVYLSIGTDRTVERWKKGINSGLYTSPEYLNVNTEELALSHPFAKYYNIQSLPFIVLIDKNGRIHSSNATLGKTVYNSIKEALNQPISTK